MGHVCIMEKRGLRLSTLQKRELFLSQQTYLKQAINEIASFFTTFSIIHSGANELG